MEIKTKLSTKGGYKISATFSIRLSIWVNTKKTMTEMLNN